MSGPLAMLNALIAEIAAIGGAEVQQRLQVSSGLFDRFGVAWQPGDTEFEQGAGDADRTSPAMIKNGEAPKPKRRSRGKPKPEKGA
jgi:hypothetical protein